MQLAQSIRLPTSSPLCCVVQYWPKSAPRILVIIQAFARTPDHPCAPSLCTLPLRPCAAGGAAQPLPRPPLPARNRHRLPGVVRLQAGGARAVPGALPLRLHGHRAARRLGWAHQEGGRAGWDELGWWVGPRWLHYHSSAPTNQCILHGRRTARTTASPPAPSPSCHHRASSWWRAARSSSAPCSASRWSPAQQT